MPAPRSWVRSSLGAFVASIGLAAVALGAGCPAPAPLPPAPVVDPLACVDDVSCAERGEVLLATQAVSDARVVLERGCAMPRAFRSCAVLAVMYVKEPPEDRAHLRHVVQLGCPSDGTIAIYDVCARLAIMAWNGDGGPVEPELAAGAALAACSPFGADNGDRASRAEACWLLGVAARDGKGRPADATLAARAFADACELGHAESCRAPPPPPRPAPGTPRPAAGANLHVGQVIVDGMEMTELSCATGGQPGELLGTVALLSGIAKRRVRLDACVKKRTVTPITFVQDAGKVTKATASGPDPKVNACVEKALTGATAAAKGSCEAMLVHGR